jgi:hypothetical protein
MIRPLVLLLCLNELACSGAAVQPDNVTKTCCDHVYEPSYAADGKLALAAVGRCPSVPPTAQCAPYVPALPGDGDDFICDVEPDGGTFTFSPDGGTAFCF